MDRGGEQDEGKEEDDHLTTTGYRMVLCSHFRMLIMNQKVVMRRFKSHLGFPMARKFPRYAFYNT